MYAAVHEKMNNSHVEITRQANKKRRMSSKYKISDLVNIYHWRISRNSQYSKQETVFLGPYIISAVDPDTDNYMLECPLVPSRQLKIYRSLLAPWHHNNNTKFPPRSLRERRLVESDSLGAKWAFECIIHHEKKKRNGVVKYWVKWEGYGDNQNTQEPEESLPPKAMKDYWRQHAWTSNQQKKRRERRNK